MGEVWGKRSLRHRGSQGQQGLAERQKRNPNLNPSWDLSHKSEERKELALPFPESLKNHRDSPCSSFERGRHMKSQAISFICGVAEEKFVRKGDLA